jgi:membrane protease YdiL (CAAX protease family)
MPVNAERRSRCGLAIFFALIAISSAFLQFDTASLYSTAGSHLVTFYMWCVAASSIVARLIMRESPRDISFRWNGSATTRALLIAFAFPLIAGIATYGIVWSTGLAFFAPESLPLEIFRISLSGSATMRFCKYLLVNLTIGALWSCKSAAGEEIGWRGYMLTRLMSARAPAPIVLSGLIWALWHMPLIFSGQYASVPHSPSSIAIFVIDITAMGCTLAWLRLYSGSIWPCIWAHGAWNAVILGAFGGSTHGGDAWVGEAGLLTALIVIAISAALYRLRPPLPEDAGVKKRASAAEIQ